MKLLAGWIQNRNTAWIIVCVVGLLSIAAGFQVGQVEHDDNILAFLPQNNPDVEAFYEINESFGSLDLALVGVESDDVFSTDFIERLRQTTKELKETRGINHVLTLSNVVDFEPDPEKGGVVTRPMIPKAPKSAAEIESLRQKVMSKDHLVGHLVSKDGKAVLLYCFLAYGSDPKTMATNIREVVDQNFDKQKKYWGGGPFVSTYIYDTTQKDIKRLTPWAVLAIIVIMMLAFRDVIGVGLVLLSTALGILLSLGVMAWFKVRFNIVLGSMPIILFAVGSAYGIHILARYYALVRKTDCQTALAQTLTGVAPIVIAAGLTTAAGLLSFVCMDIQPLRTFGVFTALGILATLVLSITFIPAVVVLSKLKRSHTDSAMLRKFTARLSVFAQSHRLPVGLVILAITLVAGGLVSRVDSRMDNASFFSEGSPPDLADKFLRRHFGGSQFIQIHAKGDMTDPHALRELRRVAEHIAGLEHVANVLHLGEAVSQGNQAFVDQKRIPDTTAQVKLILSLLGSDPSVAQLATRDKNQALLHIKVAPSRASEIEVLIEKIERIVAEEVNVSYSIVADNPASARLKQVRERKSGLVMDRTRFLARTFGIGLSEAQAGKISEQLKKATPAADPEKVVEKLTCFMASDECIVDFDRSDAAVIDKVARALVAEGKNPEESKLQSAIGGALSTAEAKADPEQVDDLLLSVAVLLEEYWKEQEAAQLAQSVVAAANIQVPSNQQGKRFLAELETTMLDMNNPTVMLAALPGETAKTMQLRVTGLPVMHRGLSISATANQIRSLIFALVLVVIIMSVFFRSIITGLLIATPTMLTLTIIYGGMGLLGVHLDIGTAMLASLILGAGVDYAVHLGSAWHAEKGEPIKAAAARAGDATGPAIWINAIMVCAGFFVLTLGEAKPLKNVGGLTAAAMLVAALATFLAIPVLARKKRYRKHNRVPNLNQTSEVVKTILGKVSR
jgi:uncharacterized protein